MALLDSSSAQPGKFKSSFFFSVGNNGLIAMIFYSLLILAETDASAKVAMPL